MVTYNVSIVDSSSIQIRLSRIHLPYPLFIYGWTGSACHHNGEGLTVLGSAFVSGPLLFICMWHLFSRLAAWP